MNVGISIIIAAVNDTAVLVRMVEDVLAQPFMPCELIVIADGSGEETEAVLAPYRDKIQYVWQEQTGLAAGRNRGLQLAQHEFVLFLDENDRLLPDTIQQQVAFLQLRPSLSFVMSGWQMEDDDVAATVEPWHLSQQPDLSWWLHFRPFPLGAILFRRVWLHRIAGFDETAAVAHPVDCMLRLCLAGGTGDWLHHSSICRPQSVEDSALHRARSTMTVLARFFEHPTVPDDLKEAQAHICLRTALSMAWALFEQGEVETAVSYLQPNFIQDDPYAHLPTEDRVTAWLVHFDQWVRENGRSPQLLAALWPFWQQAAPSVTVWPELHRLAAWWQTHQAEAVRAAVTPPQLWGLFEQGLAWEQQSDLLMAEDGLTWWAAVWRPYCQQPFEETAPHWTAFQALDQYRFLNLVRFGLLVDADQMTTVRLSLLWRDAKAHGLLAEPAFDEPAFFAALPSVRLPKVSVIVPVYNGARYIAKTVTSVLQQTYTDLELIVVDDGSTDETVAQLRPFLGQIRLVQQKNQGVSAARNHGLRLALGEFILFLDGDDWLLPDKLAKQVAYLEENHLLGAVHSGWQLVDEYGRSIRTIALWQRAPKLTLQEWLRWKPVFLGAMLFRRHWLSRVDGFDTTLRQAEDTDFLLRLSLAGCPMAWLKETTIHYRQHGSGVTQNGHQQAEDMSRVLNTFFENKKLPVHIQQIEPTVRYYTFIWLVWQLYRTGYRDEILDYLQEAAQNSVDQPPAITAQGWLVQFASYAWEEGVPLAQLSEIFPYFQQVLQLQEEDWSKLEDLLYWWLTQWEHLHQGHWGKLIQIQQVVYSGLYLEQVGHVSSAMEWVEWWLTVWQFFLKPGETSAHLEMQRFKNESSSEIVKLAQASILHEPNELTVAQIAAFWDKALADEVIHAEEKHKITALYLTYFGQAVLGKQWRRAGVGLLRASLHSWHPQGMQAWGQFVAQGVRYFGNGRR